MLDIVKIPFKPFKKRISHIRYFVFTFFKHDVFIKIILWVKIENA